MKVMLKIVFCFFLFVSISSAKEEIIHLSNKQLTKLGVKLGKLEPVEQIPLFYAPAKVTVPPTEEYLISAPQPGLISKLLVTIGQEVKKGQILANIKSPEFLAQQRQFLKAVSDRRLAYAGFQRDKRLLAEGVISERRWHETRARYLGLVAEVNEAKQILQIAGMLPADIKNLASTRRLSSQLSIRSPISGVVLDRKAVAGERVDSLSPLYHIANIETLWLEIYVPQEQIFNLKIGDIVRINDSPVYAKINLLGKNVNSGNQTVLARAVVENPDSNIRVGQRTTVQVIGQSNRQVYKIPNSGIAQKEGKYHIFVRNNDGFAVKEIEVIGNENHHSIIAGALTGQELIAVRGSVVLKANWLGLGADEESQGD